MLLPLLTLLLGTIQFGWYFYTAQSASSAAREVTRRVIVGDCPTHSEQQTFAARQASVLDLTVDPVTVPAIGQTLTMTVRANGNIIAFLPMPNGGMVTRDVEARVEDKTVGAPCL